MEDGLKRLRPTGGQHKGQVMERMGGIKKNSLTMSHGVGEQPSLEAGAQPVEAKGEIYL